MPQPTVPQAPVVAQGAPTAAQMLDAARALRRALDNQLDGQQDLRRELTRELDRMAPGSAERAGIEARLKTVDARITSLDQQIAEADARVAQASAVPGAIVPPPPRPLAVGYARRLWKRSATAVAELPREWAERFTRLEQAVDAVAVELERVGEGQRFVTNLFAEQGGRALGAGSAEPIEMRQREPMRQSRP